MTDKKPKAKISKIEAVNIIFWDYIRRTAYPDSPDFEGNKEGLEHQYYSVLCSCLEQAFEQGKLAGINTFRERLMADIQDNPTDDVEWRDGFTTMWDWIEINAEELGAEHIEYTDWVNERLKSQLSKEVKK